MILLTLLLLPATLLGLLALGVQLGFRAPRRRERQTPATLGLDFEVCAIPTRRGRRLFAWLLPAPGAEATLVILHGWGANAELMLPLAAPFHRAGLNVLLLDARNHGSSDGDTFSSLPRFAEDLEAAVDWLRRVHPARCRRLALLGHSVGAGATLYYAADNPLPDAVISIAAFADPAEITEGYLRALRLPRWLARLATRHVEWRIGHRFAEIAPLHTATRLECPLLLVHGTADTSVSPHDARRILARVPRGRARLLTVPGAGHDSVEHIEQHVGTLIDFLAAHGVHGVYHPGAAQPNAAPARCIPTP
ncbi:alpha/beta hydrolase [Marichromatium bheemlicum]|uniref:Alpha/beta hydrolase n=1 Tax=Marichromatium bheemlicum TaxID=365339 RepID=A0ABX1I865_9GAMM|nr:alpha/beta fold hydrolase [Marichromatium bheemlicum]NKN33755.1 alpha/beta hydrolase [Marichromatium bheemlicum]